MLFINHALRNHNSAWKKYSALNAILIFAGLIPHSLLRGSSLFQSVIVPYNALLNARKGPLRPENIYYWDENVIDSIGQFGPTPNAPLKDVNGNPAEVIIPCEEYKKIEESLRLDLTQEAIEDLKQAKIDRDNYNNDAYVDLESI